MMNALPHRRIVLGVAAAALGAGCAGEPPRETPTVRDSAGIAITEHGSDALARLPAWTLGSPTRSIGTERDDPAHQLTEVVAAFRRSDGRLLVGDAQSRELRVFDRDGRGVLTFGGQGEGPGELPWLNEVTLHRGDTTTVSAWPFGLLTRFGPDGSYLGSRRIGPFWSGWATNRILQDGSLLIHHADGGVGNDVEGWIVNSEEETFTPSLALIRAFEGGRLDTLRAVRRERWFKVGKFRVDLWAAAVPFAGGTLAAVAEPAAAEPAPTAIAEPAIYVGEPDRPEIEVRSLDGRLERLIRWAGEPVLLTARDRQIFADRQRGDLGQPEQAPDLERWLATVPYPETKGAFLDLAADRAGRVWVRLPAPVGADDPWLVFERDGRAVARVTVPAGGRLLDIGDGWALILLTDELDLERIEERPLLKP